MRILLVDDDAGSLRGLQMALRMLQHSCESCSDPYDALEKYKMAEYDVVITDICMPRMNGLVLGRMLRRWNPAAKILYISGEFNPTFEELANRDKTGTFLRKPIEFDELQAALNQLGCKEVQ